MKHSHSQVIEAIVQICPHFGVMLSGKIPVNVPLALRDCSVACFISPSPYPHLESIIRDALTELCETGYINYENKNSK
jgi:predicted class III extradiol MEMO1 family dioxygenase